MQLLMKNIKSRLLQSWQVALAACLLLLAQIVSAANTVEIVTYYHNDHTGTPIAATDENGNVLWREDYSPYGEQLTQDPKAATNRRGFTGHVQDRDLGLVYMQARYYDPVLGRFMAVDPVGVMPEASFTFNRYAYSNNNPYRYIDPDGNRAVGIEFGASVSFNYHIGSRKSISIGRYTTVVFDTKTWEVGVAVNDDVGIGFEVDKGFADADATIELVGTDEDAPIDVFNGKSTIVDVNITGRRGLGVTTGVEKPINKDGSYSKHTIYSGGLTASTRGADIGINNGNAKLESYEGLSRFKSWVDEKSQQMKDFFSD